MDRLRCRWCLARFSSPNDLEIHEDIHRNLADLGSTMDVTFNCQFCSSTFQTFSELINHENAHVGVERICSYCNGHFDDAKEFMEHKQMHEILDELNGSNFRPFHIRSPPNKGSPKGSPHKRRKISVNDVLSPVAGPSHENHSDTMQTGGADISNPLPYSFKQIGEKTFKNRVIDRHYQVKFNPDQALKGQKLSDLHDQLEKMFDAVIDEAKQNLAGNDLGRLVVHHDSLNSPIVVPLRPLDHLNGHEIMEHVENVLSSNQDLPMDDGFYLDVGTMELPKGGHGHQIYKLFGPNNSLSTKRAIVEIKNQDNTCLARAIIVGYLRTRQVSITEWKEQTKYERSVPIEDLILKYKNCPSWYYTMLTKKRHDKRLTDITIKLCQLAHVSTFRWLSLNDIQFFENVLDVDVLVVSSRMGNKFLRVPAKESIRKRLYVYLVEDKHFHAIVNICGFFGASKFCEQCLKPYKEKHECFSVCFVCNSKDCLLNELTQVSCIKCHMTCRSIECFNRHLEKNQNRNGTHPSMCEKYWKCTVCKKVMKWKDRHPKDHFCGEFLCKCCNQYVENSHLCYIRALEAKKSSEKYIFFDIECTQDSQLTCDGGYLLERKVNCKRCKDEATPCTSCSVCANCGENWCGKFMHRPNLIIAQKVCRNCMDEDLKPSSKCEVCGVRCEQCNEYNAVDKCFEKPPCLETCGFREMIFKGENCSREFGEWLFSKEHKDFTVFAHNLKAYDGYIILEYLIDQSIRPDSIIYSGSKIMYMHVARGLNIRFLDSVNFLPMPLKALPGAFNLKELKKGYFPHFFNKNENQNYVGPLPEAHYYGCDAMDKEERQEFIDWYESQVLQNHVFDFAKEIVLYCRSDVHILRLAMLTFRNLLMDITGREESFINEDGEPVTEMVNAVDPFTDITIASVCSRVYRTKFLTENWRIKLKHLSNGDVTDWLPAKKVDEQLSALVNGEWLDEKQLQDRDFLIEESKFVDSPIAQVPANGYNTDQFSSVSIKWLELLMEQSKLQGTPIHIQHALNEGEKCVPGTKYKLDGFCSETNTAYEFYGCFWHGCNICYPGKMQQMKFPRTQQTLSELRVLTFKREKLIKSLGFNYKFIWEHEFQNLLEQDPSAKEFVSQLDIQERLNPRLSFFGGRTNCIKLQHKIEDNEKIKYIDFTSLYPYINKYAKYPIKEPKIITSNFGDIKDYFGLISVKILPPKGLFFPVLPCKINNKLVFTLCRTCIENENQNPCNCSEEDRAMIGCWCTPELLKALEKGYRILKIYEVYHWEEHSQYDKQTGEKGLFDEYINLFLKLKQESSDWPSWVKTEDDAITYLEGYFEKEGIRLNRNRICKNKALRSLAKLLLNSFWGKFGQRLNMPQTSFFHEEEANQFFQCITDTKKQIIDFKIISSDTIHVTWQNQENMLEESLQTNIFVATFTTCWARLKLYEVLDMLQERVLYHDTDSVIYISRPGEPEPELGDFLGELTSELPENDHIVHFVSTGPKSYAYKTLKGKQCCKIKGFTLNYTNEKVLNFDSLLQQLEQMNNSEKRLLSIKNPNKISRLKYKRKLYNRYEEKKFKIVYTKRVIQKESLCTLPYGY